jgi:hypothetical protein
VFVEETGMSKSRLLIIAAVLTGGLYLVGAAALGSPPEAGDSGAQVVAWFREHDSDARLYAWTGTFATLAFAILAGIVSGLLPRPHRNIFLLGATAFIVETTLQGWFWAGLALHPDNLQPATARTLMDVAVYWGPLLTGATTTMIGAVTALGLARPAAIPRWLTVIGAIAFIEQAIETITVFGKDGFTAPGGPMNVELGAAFTLVWLVALVVWAARTLNARPAAA